MLPTVFNCLPWMNLIIAFYAFLFSGKKKSAQLLPLPKKKKKNASQGKVPIQGIIYI
jgi:hypothetical protein